ncbi:conserved membrane hypothetical protein [uncultured Paludibacter sp.]|uniref:Uncharacterized protein n=1 Tax=uncultured Paludibacter sp. TaxID=497635 RepID=A0A653AAT7_9BACT|nr:conserved membrane hypothetical protein [uncultured Paludibacter sp.]
MELKNERLQSIDALRGFDMIWIMGATGLVQALDEIFGGKTFNWLTAQMEHVSWNGFHIMDLVFPLFLFIAGLSFPFSLGKKRQKKESDKKIILELIKRAITLVILGMIYNGFLRLDFDKIRYASVLGHIGIAWLFAALIYMYSSRMRTIIMWIVIIVVGYATLNLFLISPNAINTDHFIPENNIVCQFDRWFLPGILYNGSYDPEGILSVIPAIATALLGMLTTRYLEGYINHTPTRKMITYLGIGMFLILIALISSKIIPVNKVLWSSSFMLLAGGISIMLFAFFYWIIDVIKWRKWAFFFRVIGMNTITIYLAQVIVNFWGIDDFFLGGIASKFPHSLASLILSIGYIGVCWLFLLFLYRKKVFIKV